MKIMNTDIEVILFDLGGVLIELGDNPVPSHWLPGGNRFELADWFSSQTAVAFEKGLIGPVRFAESLRKDLQLEASSADIIQQFTNWPLGFFPGAGRLLRSIHDRITLSVLSNTNELHWPRITNEFKLADYFDHMFASHQLQMAKPDSEIYEHVISELKVEPGKILFMDDNQNNIAAAKKIGMHAVRVHGLEQVQQTLAEQLVIDV